MASTPTTNRWRGPTLWAIASAIGLLLGLGVGAAMPASAVPAEGITNIDVPWPLLIPFVLLLLSIALMPFVRPLWWHDNYPGVAFFLGAFVAGVYLAAFGTPGRHLLTHVGHEYIQFMGLIFGLFTVSGGIVINVEAKGRPLVNTIILAAGAVLANIIGTTGASMLLLRPFMRVNAGRLRPCHIVFFIFIVSNCGGCLTPIGDPPLYLGFIRGVPFFWTLTHLWREWAFVNAALLAVFFLFDAVTGRGARPAMATIEVRPGAATASEVVDLSKRIGFPFSVSGAVGIVGLAIVVAAVFLDPLLTLRFGYHGPPIGPLVQIAAGVGVFFLSDRSFYERNHFTWAPVKEVACLFVGIFLTMLPALGYLARHGAEWGLTSPDQYYFLTGSLSAVLDNAPTYLTFLQLAFAKLGLTLDAATLQQFVSNQYVAYRGTPREFVIHGATLLSAISLGAVFFGAATYIGNGPNFMVKAIAESAGVKMPSFLGYLRYTFLFLLPVLVLAWFLFIYRH